jgi:hypothetical protein
MTTRMAPATVERAMIRGLEPAFGAGYAGGVYAVGGA